jgi:aerobic-type carbon monoxide dehydrogenase small subunit (CoxS/CutS family)
MDEPSIGADVVTVEVTVNGTRVTEHVPARLLLSDFIRERLGLTATHVGCEQGHCGACTIIIDGLPARSCTVLTAQVHRSTIVTLEGLRADRAVAELRSALHDHHGLQCGFCTPGIICTLAAIGPFPASADATEVRQALAGNLCRCTGYQHLVDAVLDRWRFNDSASFPASDSA